MITIQPEIEILSTESYEDMLRRIEKIGRARSALEKALQRNSSQASSNAAMNPSLSTAPSP